MGNPSRPWVMQTFIVGCGRGFTERGAIIAGWLEKTTGGGLRSPQNRQSRANTSLKTDHDLPGGREAVVCERRVTTCHGTGGGDPFRFTFYPMSRAGQWEKSTTHPSPPAYRMRRGCAPDYCRVQYGYPFRGEQDARISALAPFALHPVRWKCRASPLPVCYRARPGRLSPSLSLPCSDLPACRPGHLYPCPTAPLHSCPLYPADGRSDAQAT